jgi:hypothetical protein
MAKPSQRRPELARPATGGLLEPFGFHRLSQFAASFPLID